MPTCSRIPAGNWKKIDLSSGNIHFTGEEAGRGILILSNEERMEIEMRCEACGYENKEGTKFCVKCGTKLGEGNPASEEARRAQLYQWPKSTCEVPGIPPEYRPIGMWGYFGYSLLFTIPFIGVIVALVFAFGATQNQNLKNFARAQFCEIIIMIVLVMILVTQIGINLF